MNVSDLDISRNLRINSFENSASNHLLYSIYEDHRKWIIYVIIFAKSSKLNLYFKNKVHTF